MKKLVLCIMAVLVLFVACGKKNKEQTKEGAYIIEYWNALTGPDGPYMTKLVDAFNKEYAGKIQVKQQIIPNDDLYSKLAAAGNKEANKPDVILMDNTRIPQYVENGTLLDLTDLVKKFGIKGEDFIPDAWDATVVNGKNYAIPFDSYPFFLYYNKKILAEIGYTEADLKDPTMDKVIEMAKKAKAKGYDGMSVFDAWPWPEILFGFIKQKGLDIIDANNEYKVDFQRPEFVEAFKEYVRAVKEGVTNDPSVDGVIPFQEGKSLFKWDGIWATTAFMALKDQGIEIGVAPIPRIGEKNKMYTGSHNLTVVSKQGNSPEKNEAIVEFMNWLSKKSGDFAAAGQVPANKTTWSSDTFKKMPFAFIADYTDSFFYASKTKNFPLAGWGGLGKAATGYLNHTYPTIEEALKAVEKEVNDQLAQLEKTKK